MPSTPPYSQIGAERELVQTMAYEPMLLMVALGFYLASGSFSVGDILTGAHMNILRMPGIFFGLCFILLIKFRKSPFDISMSHEAHQELIGGLKTEISGRTLAVVEIAHWYENVFLFGLVLLFFASDTWWTWLLGLAICEIVFFRRDPHRQLLRPHQVGAHARLHLARRPHGRLSEYRIFDVL